jgi:signal transduction histidine kinase
MSDDRNEALPLGPSFPLDPRPPRAVRPGTQATLGGRTHRAVPARENEFELIANSIPQLVWRADAKGNVDHLSDQWYAFTGISRPQRMRMLSLHQDWQSAIHPDDIKSFMLDWTHSILTGEPFEAECRIHRAGSGYCWHLSRALALRDRQRRIVSWFGTSTFVDAGKREREQMLAANAAKDRFLATLSHELRTPLTPALLSLVELEDDPALPAHLQRPLAALGRSVHLLARLIGDLMDMSAVTHGKLHLEREIIDLHVVMRDALEVCRNELTAKGISVACEWRAGISVVIGDPVRLQQVFWNLLRNAGRFTPCGGHITIGSCDAPDHILRTWIQDDGVGISPDALEHIFTAFDQGRRSPELCAGGLGLGLAIARQIAELHQGTLTAHSAGAGQGATFVFELPLPPPAALASDAPAVRAPATAPPGPLQVLLVEDHVDTAHAMTRLLRSFGHQVHTTALVSAALACARTTRLDLIISDLGLPDGSGWDLLGAVRQFARTPVIAVTGAGIGSAPAGCLPERFDGYLVKPVSALALKALIARVAAHHPAP